MKINSLTGIVFGVLCCGNAIAQPDTVWTRMYPGWEQQDICKRLISTSDGGFVIGGQCGYPYFDYLFVKIDADGEMEMVRSYGSPREHDFFGGIVQMPDDGYVLAGTISREAVNTTSLLKIDADGDSVWANGYGTTEFFDVTLSHDGYAVAAGLTNEHAEYGSWDAWLVKVDDGGEVIWRHVYGGQGGDAFVQVITTQDGGFLGVGNSTSFGGMKGLIVKTDSLGNQEWLRAFSSNRENHVFLSAVETPEGGYIAGGSGRLNNDKEFYIVKFSADGDTVWSRKWGAEEVGADQIHDLVNSPGGGYLVVGEDQKARYPIIRLNEDGEVTWRFDFGNEIHSRVFNAVLTTDDGGYLIGGRNDSQFSEVEAYLVKTAPDPAYNSVSLLDPAFPSQYELFPPYPNPFNSYVHLDYALSSPSQSSIRIYNQLGHQVAEPYSDKLGAGYYQTTWDASGQAAGVYFCKLSAGSSIETRKLILLR